ncbi:MAG: HAD family hydrolase [Planctomycetia bacterium]|nr:HAD family hydrolase [Planctomycetia bacterium]
MANKALFLDRDGVINVDDHYVHRIEDFRFVDGIFELCRAARDKGYLIIVVTNQSGIERGYFTHDDFRVLTDWMIERFREEGVVITEVYYCPSLSGPDRKPLPGMFEKARIKYDLDMSRSLSLGDKERDVQAGIRAGVGTNVLFSSERQPHPAYCTIRNLLEMETML